jgi:hypothetical protein
MPFCFHDRMKKTTLQDGTVIEMCPDCTTFDNKRKAALHVEGKLAMSAGTSVMQPEPLPTTVVEKRDAVYDSDWVSKQKPFEHSHKMPQLKKNFCPLCSAYVNEKHEHDQKGVIVCL